MYLQIHTPIMFRKSFTQIYHPGILIISHEVYTDQHLAPLLESLN